MQQEMYKLTPTGALVRYSGQAIMHNGMAYSNPTLTMLCDGGFRPMGNPVTPEYDPATEQLVLDHYDLSADGTEIIAYYVAEKLPELPELTDPEPDDLAARVDALELENAWLVEALNMLLEGVVDDAESLEAAGTIV